MRPILNLELHGEFCEVFFNDVRVPYDSLVGGINQGWSMAKALLGFERIFLGSPNSPPSLSSAWSAWPGTWDCGTTLCSCAASPR